MMKPWLVAAFGCLSVGANAQDTTVIWDQKRLTLPSVVVSNNPRYNELLEKIKADTSFYKAFKNLRLIGYRSRNSIVMKNKRGAVESNYYSVTRQERKAGCRTMVVEKEEVNGPFYERNGDFAYTTAKLYASLFFTKGRICGEDGRVGGSSLSTRELSGMEKHKEQLKMLFFNPGRKIPGIPFIGNKLDLYDERARDYYDYKLDYQPLNGREMVVFSIVPKAEGRRGDNVVVDEMTTWFDAETMQVMARNYQLSYHAGVYDFNVKMEVQMARVGGLVVPQVLRYKGDWDVVFKRRENGEFTATLSDFVVE